MDLQLDEFKTRQRAVWEAGDYATLSEYIEDIGERVVARAGVEAGMSVLDVACGSGNAAIQAARVGARVTGLDLAPKLLDQGRTKAESERLDVEWVEGDAEQLPFDGDAFDRALSTVGHMFAPRHQQVANEMTRVCRPGGSIVFAAWTPEGAAGQTIKVGGSFMPPPPDYASPPILWGTEDHVRGMFPAATGFEFERHVSTIEWESPESFFDYFQERFGPLVTARQMLGDQFAELRERTLDVWRDVNEADDGTFRLPQEYLLAVVHV